MHLNTKQDDHVSAEEPPPFETQEDMTHESLDLPTLVSSVAGHLEQTHFPWSSHHLQGKWKQPKLQQRNSLHLTGFVPLGTRQHRIQLINMTNMKLTLSVYSTNYIISVTQLLLSNIRPRKPGITLLAEEPILSLQVEKSAAQHFYQIAVSF